MTSLRFTYRRTRMNKTPSKYFAEALPIAKAKAKMMELKDRNIDKGFLKIANSEGKFTAKSRKNTNRVGDAGVLTNRAGKE